MVSPKLIDQAELRFRGTYYPFEGMLDTVYIDLDKSLVELMEEEQLDYNPMVGEFALFINASFKVDGAEVVENDGKFMVENYDELFESGLCNVEELIALKKACETEAKWKINERGDGVECDILVLRMSVLKAYDFRFDVSVDTEECADAVSGDMQLLIEKAMQLQSYAREEHEDVCIVDDDDVGVVMLHDITYERNLITSKAVQWILSNISAIVVNYVPTAVYVVAIDKEQAYYDMEPVLEDMFEQAAYNAGFVDHKETSSKYKWMLDV